MDRRRMARVLGISTLGLLGCCGGRPRPEATAAQVEAVVRASNTFAARLHQRLAAEPGNLLHAPLGVSSALALALAGARGETERELRAALELPAEPHAALGALLWDLDRRRTAARRKDDDAAGKPAYQLELACAVWPQRGYPLGPDWVELLRASYGAEARALDFAADPEAARRAINGWVASRTQGRIQELLAGPPPPELRLALTSAVHFKAAWDEPFYAAATRDEPFHLAGGEPALVPTMHRTDPLASKRVEDLLDVVQLPYRGGGASMLLIVPTELDGLPAVEARLAHSLADWTRDLEHAPIALALPRLRFSARFVLNEALKSMGARRAFEPTADFRGISPTGGLFLGLVVHQAFIAVDEEGTEAAAATEVEVLAAIEPTPPREVRADRPFLFLIRDEPSGAIIFLGRVADPRG